MSTHLDAIELRHLRYFAALAEELHFGRAAARCNLSQPPFSVAIQQLESHLGARLFVRSSRRVELTENGRAFYRQARALLDQAHGAFSEAQARAGGVRPVLRVGFHGSMLFRGQGVAIVPGCLAHTGIRGVVFRPTTPSASATVQCIHRQPSEAPQLAEFVRLARETIVPGWRPPPPP